MASEHSTKSIVFAEFVRPTFWVLLPSSLLGAGAGLVALPLIEWWIVAALSLIVTASAFLAFLKTGYKVAIETSENGLVLRVGSASIPVVKLGKLRIVAGSEMRDERGPKLHALSYRRFQSGVKDLVVIEITDASDPTPFWVFNLRKAKEFVAALEDARS